MCESSTVKETGRDQYHSENNWATYKLWMWEQQSRRDKQRSAPFWIPEWQPDYLQAMSMSKYESNTVKKTGRDQFQSEFSNDNQMTYKLWYDSNTVEETHGSAIFRIL